MLPRGRCNKVANGHFDIIICGFVDSKLVRIIIVLDWSLMSVW